MKVADKADNIAITDFLSQISEDFEVFAYLREG